MKKSELRKLIREEITKQRSILESVSLVDMYNEMQSWVQVSPKTLSKAKVSKITTSNNKEFKRLVNQWERGIYDEDPEMLVQELDNILINSK